MSKTVTEIIEDETEQVKYKYMLSVRFVKANKAYSFGTNEENITNGAKVIVETQRGLELGEVISDLKDAKEHTINIPLKPILRIANQEDLENYEQNIIDSKKALAICREQVANLNLKMDLISAEYTLDRSKITFIYIADQRVDFRELLKVLAQIFHTRIDLRQIGPRDKSKIVGGIGVCGRQLCCKFKNNFEVVSINLAKNQLLALNIQKLSGQCGKLKCCLRYENDYYTEMKENLPKINSHVIYDNQDYKLASMNILTDTCKLENKSSVIYPLLSEVIEHGTFKKKFKKDNVSNQDVIKTLKKTKIKKEEAKPINLKIAEITANNTKDEDGDIVVPEEIVKPKKKNKNNKRKNNNQNHKPNKNKNKTKVTANKPKTDPKSEKKVVGEKRSFGRKLNKNKEQ